VSGRIELLCYLREQTISRTMHRYGNLIGMNTPDDTHPGGRAG